LASGELPFQDGQLQVYRFKQRVTWEESEEYGLGDWKPFQQVSEQQKKDLAVEGGVTPIFIGSTLTEYYATLVTKEKTI